MPDRDTVQEVHLHIAQVEEESPQHLIEHLLRHQFLHLRPHFHGLLLQCLPRQHYRLSHIR